MTRRNFREMLEQKWSQDRFVCVGLDSDYGRIPDSIKKLYVRGNILAFNKAIVDATYGHVCAFKFNRAFYAKHGKQGLDALHKSIQYIKRVAADVPIIFDSKYEDVDNTNIHYVHEAFEFFQADAVTVSHYPGSEAYKPFLEQKDKGIIVVCYTTNKGAGEFQDLLLENSMPIYQYVAKTVAEKWNGNGNCAVVAGATYPIKLRAVRQIIDDMPILIPGIGSQGGDVKKTVTAGKDSRGKGIIINSSSGIIFASGENNFTLASQKETIKLSNKINEYR